MASWWDELWNRLFYGRQLEGPAQGQMYGTMMSPYHVPLLSGQDASQVLANPQPGKSSGGGLDFGPWMPAVQSIPIVGGWASLFSSSPASSPSSTTPAPSPTTSAAPKPSATAPPTTGANEAESAAAKAVAAAMGGGGQQGNPLYGNVPTANVYMGKGTVATGGGGPAKGDQNLSQYGSSGYRVQDKYESLQEVIASVNDWGTKEIARFNKLAIGAGLLKQPTTNLDEISNIWSNIAVRTAMMNERGHKITPWSLLGRYANGQIKLPGSGPKTTTSTNTSVNYLDKGTSTALINNALAKVLGRAPTKSEKAKFLEALKAEEKKNPSTTTTTTTTNGDRSTSKTTSSGGMSGEAYNQFAEDWAMGHNKPEAQAYQAATYYMSALFDALSAPV